MNNFLFKVANDLSKNRLIALYIGLPMHQATPPIVYEVDGQKIGQLADDNELD